LTLNNSFDKKLRRKLKTLGLIKEVIKYRIANGCELEVKIKETFNNNKFRILNEGGKR